MRYRPPHDRVHPRLALVIAFAVTALTGCELIGEEAPWLQRTGVGMRDGRLVIAAVTCEGEALVAVGLGLLDGPNVSVGQWGVLDPAPKAAAATAIADYPAFSTPAGWTATETMVTEVLPGKEYGVTAEILDADNERNGLLFTLADVPDSGYLTVNEDGERVTVTGEQLITIAGCP